VNVVWREFWKASLISLVTYTIAILVGLWVGLWILLFVPAIQLVSTAICIIRVVQLRRCGGHKLDGLRLEQEDYGFYLGGLISSFTLLLALVAWSQLLTRASRLP